jgi:cysteinyl-tRNA synthetase
MTLKLFNTLTRKKQAFKPIREGEVGMYVCGPTVNGVPHLGHARQQVIFDILRKYLRFSGYKVKFVSNITDIDDKIINKAKELGEDLVEFTQKNLKTHLEDYQKIGVEKPDVQTKATEYIKEMIELVKKLEAKKYIYVIPSDGVYFDISKFKKYGKLSHQNIEYLKSGARVNTNDEKKNKEDFVLWKFSKPGEPKWHSPWGEGRPGWHIECSAMSEAVLGLPFDIHGGGQDLIFPHHEDEIAQSESAFGKKMVNYWVHNGMVNVDNVKMSKSLGNYKTIKDLLAEYDGRVIRYFVITNHYRKPLDFNKKGLEDAKTAYERLKNILMNVKDDGKLNEKCINDFKKAMDDDLNTSRALAVLWKFVRDEKAEGKIKTIIELDKVLGLDLLKKEKIEVPEEVRKLAEERWQAKKIKNFKLADELREKIGKLGFVVADSNEEYEVRKA